MVGAVVAAMVAAVVATGALVGAVVAAAVVAAMVAAVVAAGARLGTTVKVPDAAGPPQAASSMESKKMLVKILDNRRFMFPPSRIGIIIRYVINIDINY
jgi:hypothetical protein